VLWEGAHEPLVRILPEDRPDALTLVVGPEGGIPEEDAREAERAGARLAGLGPNILRTETAAVAASAVALGRYGRLG
jgi:16S rRNA (uracil1498-N3)-methyltransferase